MTLGDEIVILNDGVLVERGTPRGLFEEPTSEFTAKFLGPANVWTARFRRHESSPDRAVFAIGDSGAIYIEGDAADGLTPGTVARVMVRPNALRVSGGPQSEGAADGCTEWEATIARSAYLGDRYELTCVVRGMGDVEVHVPAQDMNSSLTVGSACTLGIPRSAVTVLKDGLTSTGGKKYAGPSVVESVQT